MKKLFTLFKTGAKWVRRYVSPVFVLLLAVSFTLWYISKLGDTYTTKLDIKVNVGDELVIVPCEVEGKGTKLFGYEFYNSRRVNISISELDYNIVAVDTTAREQCDLSRVKVEITPKSMQSALSEQIRDLKIVSIGKLSEIYIPKND